MTANPTVSIVINTDARTASLRKTLESLRYLRYPQFEVVVVPGPTRDGTHEMLAAWQGQIKIGDCPQRNLSQSRNIGIGISSGEIVAFLDDDAVPEPEWLDDVVPAFADPAVGAAGGFLHDHTGKAYQWRFGTVNRFATADQSWERATPEYNFPFSLNIPHVIGANSIFRRAALIEVGGFDEEFEYYLDETDLVCRIVDHGWRVAQLDRAFVHHKFMPSHIRNQHRVVTNWYPIIKNKAYFSLIHGRPYASVERIVAEVTDFIDGFRNDVRWALDNGMLAPGDADRFEQEADRALHDGMERGFRGRQQLAAAQRLAGDTEGFLPFRTHLPAARQRCFVLLSALYPPGPVGGIGRYVHILARAMARLGHQVHVLTRGEEHDRVDFEDGVWVHRCVVHDVPAPEPGPDEKAPLPAHLWNYSATMLEEARDIAARRPVDCVHAPIWDVEGIAFARDGTLPLITGLHTTLDSYLDSNPERRCDDDFMQTFAEPVLAAERELLVASDGLLANSGAIVAEIEKAYELPLDRSRVRVVPHGLENWYALPAEPPPPLPEGTLRLVFVGRLEARKGIDVVLRVALDLLSRHPHLWLDLVGSDRVLGPDGRTWREAFEAAHAGLPALTRIAFHGEVAEERLRGFYHAADIVLAPSRFESFGLVHLEAMMMGRAVIGCRAGGMAEVIDDGRTGLLAAPGDDTSLRRCIERLVADNALRRQLGEAARAEFLSRFTAARMAEREAAFMAAVAAARAEAGPVPLRMEGSLPQRISPAGGRRYPRRIALIGGALARNDAISADVANTWRYLSDGTGWEVSLLTQRNDFCDIPARLVAGVADLLMAPEFLAADLVIYHFGIFNPLFDALVVGNGRARQAVFFHNITPPELVAPRARPDAERSFTQLSHLHHADRLWPVSRVNAELLIERGFDPARIEVLPGAVTRPRPAALRDKTPLPVELLFLGRIVPSKGVGDLIEAILRLRDRPLPAFRLRIVGNLEYSDSAYCEGVRQKVALSGLAGIVAFVGTVDDDHRDRLLHAAHILTIPSYHEGFCKPVIEGLRAGCVPVGYAAYNLKYVAEGVCRMVPPGDIAALSEALAEMIADVSTARTDPAARLRLDRGRLTAAEFTDAARAVFEQYQPTRIATLTRERAARLLAPEFSLPAGAAVCPAGAAAQTKPVSQRLRCPMRAVCPEITVLPDDRARERERASLNRLPDLSDWESGGALSDIMRDLRQPVTIHRKSWEYALCIHGLSALGMVSLDASCLAVGAGSETPLYYFANMVNTVVATDLYDDVMHEGTPLMLQDPRHFAPFPYREDRLRVLRMSGDKLDFPDASFDFVFCLSSIEHFGSRTVQARSLDEMARVLRPNGVACIITELILTEHRDHEYFRWDELDRMFLQHPHFMLDGGEPDLTISESLVAFPVDLEHSNYVNRSPHIVLKRGEMLWTSFSMFLRRIGE